MIACVYGVIWILAQLVSVAQEDRTGDITITLTGIRNTSGAISVNLFNSATGFPSDHTRAIKRIRSEIAGNSCIVTFKDIPFGVYAVSVYHDENNDHVFNETWYGMPKEDVGISNNAPITFREPKFEEAIFNHNTSLHPIVISLKYF